MADDCCASACGSSQSLNDPRWRRVLWIALALNATMFGVEIIAGFAAHSRSLQADALDFLGDSANYAISLGVAGMALSARARGMGQGADDPALWHWRARFGDLGFDQRGDPRPRGDGRGRISRADGQSLSRPDALSLPDGGRQYALGLDLLAQRRDQQLAGDRGGTSGFLVGKWHS